MNWLRKLLERLFKPTPAPPPTPRPTLEITVEPSVVTAGGTVQVTWNASDAHTVTLTEGSQSRSVGSYGSYTFVPSGSTVIHGTATGPGGTAQAQASITVRAVPVPPPQVPPPPPQVPPPPPTVPPPPVGSSGPLALRNRPSWATRVAADTAFTQPIPRGRELAYMDGWGTNWNEQGFLTNVVHDGRACLQWRYPPGQTAGNGRGNLARIIPSNGRVYLAFRVMWSPGFEWNPISTKLAYMEPGNSILEHMWDNTWKLHSPAGGDDNAHGSPEGRWVEIEWIKDGGTSVVYQDNVEVLRGAVNSGAVSEVKLDSTWGGASGPSTRESFRWCDRCFVATA